MEYIRLRWFPFLIILLWIIGSIIIGMLYNYEILFTYPFRASLQNVADINYALLTYKYALWVFLVDVFIGFLTMVSR